MSDEIVPRYEFRVFAPSLGRVIDEIRLRAPCEEIEETTDTYLVTAVNDTQNLKLRDQQLDIKVLINVEAELEQWRPKAKLDFPLTAVQIREQVFPALQVEAPDELATRYQAEAMFLMDLMWPHTAVRIARVFKRRFHFMIAGCMVEYGDLFINGAAIQSAAVEATDAAAVQRVRAMIGLDDAENVNYVLAIKRIMGLAPLPDRRWR